MLLKTLFGQACDDVIQKVDCKKNYLLEGKKLVCCEYFTLVFFSQWDDLTFNEKPALIKYSRLFGSKSKPASVAPLSQPAGRLTLKATKY